MVFVRMWLLCYKLDLLSYSFLFHTCWDLHYEVISFVSLIGRTMYFHSRSPKILKISRPERKHLSTYKKNNIPWKVLGQFLFTCCDASKNSLVRCAHSFVLLMHRNSWITTFVRTFHGIISISQISEKLCPSIERTRMCAVRDLICWGSLLAI